MIAFGLFLVINVGIYALISTESQHRLAGAVASGGIVSEKFKRLAAFYPGKTVSFANSLASGLVGIGFLCDLVGPSLLLSNRTCTGAFLLFDMLNSIHMRMTMPGNNQSNQNRAPTSVFDFTADHTNPLSVLLHHVVTYAIVHGWWSIKSNSSTVGILAFSVAEIPVAAITLHHILRYHHADGRTGQSSWDSEVWFHQLVVALWFLCRVLWLPFIFLLAGTREVAWWNPGSLVVIALGGVLYWANLNWFQRIAGKVTITI